LTELLKIPEVATELRVSRETVYDRIRHGLIKTVNIARPGQRSKTRVRRSDLDAYIKSCEVPPLRKGAA
jgi:excisionase family DNA binding protein